MLTCAAITVPPQISSVEECEVIIEAFRYYNGMIFVVKSEILLPKYYYYAKTIEPRRKRVWMEVYISDGMKIILYKVVRAKIIPAKPESWDWEYYSKDFKVEGR